MISNKLENITGLSVGTIHKFHMTPKRFVLNDDRPLGSVVGVKTVWYAIDYRKSNSSFIWRRISYRRHYKHFISIYRFKSQTGRLLQLLLVLVSHIFSKSKEGEKFSNKTQQVYSTYSCFISFDLILRLTPFSKYNLWKSNSTRTTALYFSMLSHFT